MLSNRLKITFRTLWNNKLYSIINILGLSIAMAVVILIATYVSFDLSYDKFQPEKENIYRHTFHAVGAELNRSGTVSWLGPYLKDTYPQVKDYLRILHTSWVHGGVIIKPDADSNDKFVERKAYFADPNLLEFFHLPLLKGNRGNLLTDPFQMIISDELARKYYGSNWASEKLIGKNIQIIKHGELESQWYTITGIFQKQPNSHFRPDVVMSMKSRPSSLNAELDLTGSWKFCFVYFKMVPGTDPTILDEAVDKFITGALQERNNNQRVMKVDGEFVNLGQIHHYVRNPTDFEPPSDIRLSYFLICVGLFIMICAWVNYLNMAITKSLKRAKEVGVRKTLGAQRFGIVLQFLMEGFWLNLFSGVLAINLAVLAFPIIDSQYLVDHNGWPLYFWVNGQPSIIAFILFVFTTVVAGTFISALYPAFTISAFNVIKVLKEKNVKQKGMPGLRQGLVMVQFVISSILIIGIFAAITQLKYMMNKDLGFDKEQHLVLTRVDGIETENYQSRAMNLKNELAGISGVKEVTSSSALPAKGWGGALCLSKYKEVPAGMDAVNALYNQAYTMTVTVGENFLDFYDVKLLAGRWFPPQAFSTSGQHYLVVNEKFMTDNGFETFNSIVGKTVYVRKIGGMHEFSHTAEIIGVVENYHHSSLKEDYLPMAFRPAEISSNGDITYNAMRYISLKMMVDENSKTSTTQVVNQVNEIWKKHFPELPHEYFFLDDLFNDQYKKDIQLSRIFGLFGGLSIFISCLGLFGLSSILIQQRTKEIGIRKILGASLKNLFTLLSKNYVKLVLAAGVLSIPIAYLGIQQWLEDFAFRMELHWWFFVIPLMVLFIIAITTVGYKIIKTARANPVEALRYE